MATPMLRKICSTCKKLVPVRIDGKLKYHLGCPGLPVFSDGKSFYDDLGEVLVGVMRSRAEIAVDDAWDRAK